jgi:hypothetical protein
VRKRWLMRCWWESSGASERRLKLEKRPREVVGEKLHDTVVFENYLMMIFEREGATGHTLKVVRDVLV